MPEQYNVSPILNYSIIQTIKWLDSEFQRYSGKKIDSQVVTGPAALRQMSARLERPDQPEEGTIKMTKLKYPYMLYTIGDISLDSERGGYNKRAFKDLIIRKDIDAGTADMADLRPVKLGLGLSFNSSDFNDILMFAHTLILSGPAKTLIMDAKDSTFRIATKVVLPESVSAPPVNYETPGDAYQFEALLTVNTFMGVERTQGLIKTIKFGVSEVSNPYSFYEGDITKDPDYTKLVDRSIHFTDYFKENPVVYGDTDVND